MAELMVAMLVEWKADSTVVSRALKTVGWRVGC